MDRLDDFAVLFSYIWYRDFPVAHSQESSWEFMSTTGNVSDWNRHVGIVVSQCAHLMGLFPRFETLNRHDAVLYDSGGVARVTAEWEWQTATTGNFNEPKKLAQSDVRDFAFLLFYEHTTDEGAQRRRIAKNWNASFPLLLATVTFSGLRRRFDELVLSRIEGQRLKELRRSPALPWDVRDTRWYVQSPMRARDKNDRRTTQGEFAVR